MSLRSVWGWVKAIRSTYPLLRSLMMRFYLWAFDQIVPGLVDSFEPDILVTQLGTDSHYLDRMTQLSLTTDGYSGLVSRMKRMAPKWVALGGGGYEASVVIRCWTLAYGIMIGRRLV